MRISLKIAGILIGIALLAAFFLGISAIRDQTSSVRIAFLDIGQGDAILITRGSNQVLIDTGKNSRLLLFELGRLLPPWDRTIETVLLTHSDQDHIGALPDLLLRYRTEAILSADISNKTEIGRAVSGAIALRNIRNIDPALGLSVAFSPEIRLEILYPENSGTFSLGDTNAKSVVARFRVGRDTFLFTGDLSKEERVIFAEDIRVLKVSHHGSKYSTSDIFLDRMMPEEAIISVGKNSYGHPAKEILERLEGRGIHTLRTDMSGTIVYNCPIASNASCELIRSER